MYNPIVIYHVSGSRGKRVGDLSRGIGNLLAKVANEIPEGHLIFVPSELNSVDNLTRERTVQEQFDKNSKWFQPHKRFNEDGISHSARIQWKKINQLSLITVEE